MIRIDLASDFHSGFLKKLTTGRQWRISDEKALIVPGELKYQKA